MKEIVSLPTFFPDTFAHFFFFSNAHDFPHIHPKMKLNSLLPQAAQQLEEFGLQTGSQLRSSA